MNMPSILSGLSLVFYKRSCMKTRSTITPVKSQPNQHSANTLRQLLFIHRNAVYILFLSALVGIIAGLLSTLFDLAIDQIMHFRGQHLTENSQFSFSTVAWLIGSSCGLSAIGFYLVIRFAPETSGSGIPEIEGVLEGDRPLRWWRVIPIKFMAGISTISAGLVLGREGPSVQMGASAGAMISDLFKQKNNDTRDTLVASGAAAGLAAAFNAPLAGMMFVIEEMRPEFKYNLISLKAVMIASIMATITYRSIQGQGPMLPIPAAAIVPLDSLLLFLVFGAIFGGLGVLFNYLVIFLINSFEQFHQQKTARFILIGAVLGGIFGALLLFYPSIAGSGSGLIPDAVAGHFSVSVLLMLFFLRAITTLLCFSSGASGGVFAPMLALGALFGAFFGNLSTVLFPSLEISIGMFAITGMSALFAATVRAPLTGILLVIELTQEYTLILPLMVTTFGAALTAQALGGKPLYSQLLVRSQAKKTPKINLPP